MKAPKLDTTKIASLSCWLVLRLCTPTPEVIWKASKENVISGKGNHKLSGPWQLMLLGDGSPTRHLKLLTGHDVDIKVISMAMDTNTENEVIAKNGGQVPFTSTDQKGNFRIGDGLTIDQTTSTIRGRDFNRAIQAQLTPLILALR